MFGINKEEKVAGVTENNPVVNNNNVSGEYDPQAPENNLEAPAETTIPPVEEENVTDPASDPSTNEKIREDRKEQIDKDERDFQERFSTNVLRVLLEMDKRLEQIERKIF